MPSSILAPTPAPRGGAQRVRCGGAVGIGPGEEGQEAELVGVDGDPLSDIAVLTDAARIGAVVQAGEVVKNLDGPA